MPSPIVAAQRLLRQLQVSELANLVAQADARHILLEVGELPENFPRFTEALDDRVTALAYAFMAAGCSLAEQGERPEGATALERAARLLRSVYSSSAPNSKEAGFHILLASMAAYAAGQYSWAFVMLKSVQHKTIVAQLISSYLRRDSQILQDTISQTLLSDEQEFDSEHQLADIGITRAIARAMAFTMEFNYIGHISYLEQAHVELRDAMVISVGISSPAWWWVARLLKLMLSDLQGASPWVLVPPYLGASEATLLAFQNYARLLAFDEQRPVFELWKSQREALPHALGTNPGAVVSLKTSGGKTRVAELAILQTLTEQPESKILFLAPFRSLAFEMEQTLARTFRPLGYEISHLYGGARASRSDVELTEEAHIIVATPEKARAIFRGAPTLFSEIKLIIIDEGHLLDSDPRNVRNEMYFEHLRVRARLSETRILLLSAALPNAAQIAQWIAGDPNNLGSSQWRPSLQRSGLLRWDGSRVRLEWRGDYRSFNPHFVVAKPTSQRKNAKKFPSNRNEAIAATAVRLYSDARPVMIFTAQARSVGSMAAAVLAALTFEKKLLLHSWPEREWKVFEAACEEELLDGAIELRAAQHGVICHSNSLPAQVRLAMEHLMRSAAPRIVIATKTLAQGVNLGVTTVIVASTQVDHNRYVDQRDFLNIAGRAGRGFVDVEGKILFVIDDTNPSNIRAQESKANDYLNGAQSDLVVSGVLQIIRSIKLLALQVGINFEHLLEMAAEDDFSRLGENCETASKLCDLLDDALLSLHEDSVLNGPAEEPVVWVEKIFRESLSALQARATNSYVTSNEVVTFLTARANAALRRAPTAEGRRAVVSSSLPFKDALRVFDGLADWTSMLDAYQADGETFDALVQLVAKVEEWMRSNTSNIAKKIPEQAVLDKVRRGWLEGIPLKTLCQDDKESHEACRDFYGFSLTWLIHAAAQQLHANDDEDRAEVLDQISLCVELGLPSSFACRIFLAGIRSRRAAVELATTGMALGESIAAIMRNLRDPAVLNRLRQIASPRTAQWLDYFSAHTTVQRRTVPSFRPFSLEGVDPSLTLFVRSYAGELYLSTLDGRYSTAVLPSDGLPFDLIANDPRCSFSFSRRAWNLQIRDPGIQ